MIDLSGQTVIKHEYEEMLDGSLLITFKDNLDVELGQFKIEKVRYRKFLETLSQLAKEQYGNLTPTLVGARTRFHKSTKLAVSEF